jgi:hypothetical protein
LLTCEESIPGSTCVSIGGDQYVFLPKEGTYTLQFKGTGTGPATIQTDTFSNDIRIPVTAYTDIPVTVNTEGTFVVDSSAPQDATVQVDQNGDGTIDTYVASDTGTLSLSQLLTNLKGAVQSLSTTKPQQKIQLLNKVTNIESKIDKQKQKQSNVLAKLQAQIAKKVGKGKIDTTTANSVSSLLDDLISQSTLVPLDNTLIRQLKDQINAAAITSQLKTNLLAKVARLESILGINRSLDTMSKAVIKKGTKGVLTDAEMQNLLNLLDQIQSAI